MIGIIVEGASDEKIVNKICKRINKRVKPISMGGGQILNEKAVKNRIEGLKKEGCKKIIVLGDSDEKTGEQKKGEIKDKLKIKENDIKICVAVHKIESWLLGCFNEYRSKNPDNVSDPVKEIENLNRRKYGAKYTYNKAVDGPRIAELNKLQHFKKSQSFTEFELKIRDC